MHEVEERPGLQSPQAPKRISWRIVIALALLSGAGCVEAEQGEVIRYDPKKDELHVMSYYLNICAETSNESAHVPNVWRNRAYIVPQLPFPLGEFQFGGSALLKTGPRELQRISLGQTVSREKPIKTSFDLSQVQIKPGQFFLNEQQNLCAYHYVVFSGEAFTGMLDISSESIRGLLSEAIKKERARRKSGGKQISWNDARLKMFKEFTKAKEETKPMAPKKESATSDSPFEMLDDESLDLLSAAIGDKTLALRREGPILSLVLNLSERDCREAQASMAMWNALLQQSINASKEPSENQKEALEIASLFKVKAEKSKLSATVDLQAIFKTFFSTAAARKAIARRSKEPMDEKRQVARRNTVAAIRGEGIKVDSKMTIEGLFKQFDSGEAPTVPPTEVVEPGKGLFSRN